MSADPAEKLAKWSAKKEVPFALLGDESHATLEAWGVWGEKSFLGRKFMGVARATFLVGSDGRIAKAWPKVSPPGHAGDVLKELDALGLKG